MKKIVVMIIGLLAFSANASAAWHWEEGGFNGGPTRGDKRPTRSEACQAVKDWANKQGETISEDCLCMQFDSGSSKGDWICSVCTNKDFDGNPAKCPRGHSY